MLQNAPECGRFIYGMQQNVAKCNGCRSLIHEIVGIAEAETTECYEVIYNLILAPAFRSIPLIRLSIVRYIPTISITG